MRQLPLRASAYIATLVPVTAIAQTVEPAADQNVPTDTAIPSLMFFTFGIVLIIALGALAYFLRKRSNREATEKVLNPNHPSNR